MFVKLLSVKNVTNRIDFRYIGKLKTALEVQSFYEHLLTYTS